MLVGDIPLHVSFEDQVGQHALQLVEVWCVRTQKRFSLVVLTGAQTHNKYSALHTSSNAISYIIYEYEDGKRRNTNWVLRRCTYAVLDFILYEGGKKKKR